tara:strand:- start:63 stop:206 length:144 start_codon:yes stop_codon:yes gene_type:complete
MVMAAEVQEEVVPEEPIQELAAVEDMLLPTVIVEDLALLLYHMQELK